MLAAICRTAAQDRDPYVIFKCSTALAEHITVLGIMRGQQLGKTLPEFIRSQADKRKAEGDSIWQLLIESAEYVEATLKADEPEPSKPTVRQNGKKVGPTDAFVTWRNRS